MKVHNNTNYLKSLGPTPAEIQAALLAEQKRKPVKIDSTATEKIKKFEQQVSGAQKKGDKGPRSRREGPGRDPDGPRPGEKPAPKEPPPSPPRARIDIRI